MATTGHQSVGRPAIGPDLDPGHRRGPATLKAIELAFESTEGFEADMGCLPDPIRARVVDEINRRCSRIPDDRPAFDATLSRPFEPSLPVGFEPTLSVLDVGEGHRVILAVDDDPLFGRVLITLLRLVEPGEEAAAYRAAASMLYGGA